MELIILVVVVVAVIGLVRSARRRKADHQAEHAAAETGPEQVPTFKVVALGLPGSGKTVLLASMFHELDHIGSGRSFYLDATPEQRVALNGVYRTVSDTRQEWPRGTRLSELSEYVFSCIALDEDGARHHLLDVVYIDYAGELLEHAPEVGRSSFQALQDHIHSAQALLGLLDGQRILQLLRGEPAGHDYLQFELRSLLGLLQSARAPVQLVITKWDLVRGFGEPPEADDRLRLDRVISALMAYDHVRGLVYSNPNQLVRLIPVSAVGRGFAELREDGSVVKRSGGTVRPMNVEVPLCAVVPDLFRQVERSIDDATRRKMEASLRRSAGRSMTVRAADVLAGLGGFLNGSAGRALRAVFTGMMPGVVGVAAGEVTRMFAEWAATPYQRVADERELHEAEFGRYRAARERVLIQLENAVRRLEAIMPNSELGRR